MKSSKEGNAASAVRLADSVPNRGWHQSTPRDWLHTTFRATPDADIHTLTHTHTPTSKELAIAEMYLKQVQQSLGKHSGTQLQCKRLES